MIEVYVTCVLQTFIPVNISLHVEMELLVPVMVVVATPVPVRLAMRETTVRQRSMNVTQTLVRMEGLAKYVRYAC